MGVLVQRGVPVGQRDQPGLLASVPVLALVAGPWGVVEGCCCPAPLEPHSSQESGSPLLLPPTLCKLFHRRPGSPLGASLR